MLFAHDDEQALGDLVDYCEGSKFCETAFAFAKQDDQFNDLREIRLELEDVLILIEDSELGGDIFCEYQGPLTQHWIVVDFVERISER